MIALLLTLVPVPAAFARQDALETRVRSAALFKNGIAFVERAGTIRAGADAARLEGLPVPVHGSLWIAAEGLRGATARKDETRVSAPARSIEDLLRANVGRDLELLVGNEEWIRGKVLEVAEAPLPEAPDPRRGAFYVPPPAVNLVLLESSAGTIGLPWTQVQRVVASQGSLARAFERRRESVSLTVDLEPKSEATVPLSLLYLGRGLTWVPSYAIDLTDAAEATLTAKAEVINETEDLEGTTLRFVTGYPNLRFGHVPDPIAMQQDLQTFLSALGAPVAQMDATLRQSVAYNVALPAEGFGGFPTGPPPIEGEAAEDLFLYERPDVTLRRGERALFPLFSVRVPYEHVYEWEIPDTIDEDPYRARPVDPQPREEEIWHSICLTNASSLPWTTAPAMTMKGGRLLGQDVLHYAAVGASTTVRITRAVDEQGEQAEVEVSRERGAAKFYGTQYDLVRVRGEIRATNRKREAVTLSIEKRIQGEMKENPDGAEVVAEAKGLRRVNPNLRLAWSVPLEAGKTRTLGYEYTLYVRS